MFILGLNLNFSFRHKIIFLVLSIVLSAGFHYGVKKHQSSGPELLKNSNFQNHFEDWKKEGNSEQVQIINQPGLDQIIINSANQGITQFTQKLSVPNRKMVKIRARLGSIIENPGSEKPFELIFSVNYLNKRWYHYSIATISKTIQNQEFGESFWIDEAISELSLSLRIPANQGKLIIHSLSVQTVDSKKLFGLSFHRLGLLFIVISCVLLLWVLISSYALFPIYINILSTLTVGLFIYLLKSSMGYNFFSGFSLGIWSWLKSVVYKLT